MDITDILKTVGKYTPQLAMIIAKNTIPGAGIIADIAQAFNATPDNHQQIQQNIDADPEATVKLAEIEQKYMYLSDVNKSQNLGIARPFLVILVPIVLVATFMYVLYIHQDDADEHIIDMFIDVFAFAFVLIIFYCFSISAAALDFFAKILTKFFK